MNPLWKKPEWLRLTEDVLESFFRLCPLLLNHLDFVVVDEAGDATVMLFVVDGTALTGRVLDALGLIVLLLHVLDVLLGVAKTRGDFALGAAHACSLVLVDAVAGFVVAEDGLLLRLLEGGLVLADSRHFQQTN